MNKIDQPTRYVALAALLLALPWQPARADEFTAADLERWQQEYMAVVDQGEKLFHGGLDSKNTVSCDQCHPDASNTHPETYPKFQQQLGRVAVLAEMINWCIENPLESDPLALDDPRMIALQAYISFERRGVALAPGKH
ncbi:MAG: cytochrome C [Gammaproteobacteria bacterium]|jgi:thiosulfate dehydrogenase